MKPKLVAQVNFATWTADNLLRQASFKGLREDKPADEVRREEPSVVPKSSGSRGASYVASAGVAAKVTNVKTEDFGKIVCGECAGAADPSGEGHRCGVATH